MVSTSPYSLVQSEPIKWRPQEDRVASAFVGITFFLFLETLFEIFRVFKKRRGLYFWSLLTCVLSTAIVNIAIVLKYLTPGTKHIWALYTLMALVGWTCYSLGQLVVLYSRLHLVADSPRLGRWVLYLICACAFLFVIPIWIVVWPAWNIDKQLTTRWSAPDGIVERFTQLGFTLAETTVSGVYIHALLRLLNYKPTVRQRRVFLDLVYVNVITIALDITSTALVYLNQTGVSHPVQTFSYILKFRLEFLVLNQLMAVAARGLRRETFGEKRYHDDSIPVPFTTSLHEHRNPYPSASESEDHLAPKVPKKPRQAPQQLKGETEISVPAPVLEDLGSRSKSSSSETSSSLALQHRRSDTPNTAKQDRHSWISRAGAIVRALKLSGGYHFGGGGGAGEGVKSVPAKKKGEGFPGQMEREDDEDDDEIPLHMWERNGEIVMRIPWFERREAYDNDDDNGKDQKGMV